MPGSPPGPDGPDPSTLDAPALRARWSDGIEEMRPLLRSIRDRDTLRRIERLAMAYLEGRVDLFGRRVEGLTGPPSLAFHDAAFRTHRLALQELRRSGRSGVLSREFADLQARCCRHLELGRVRAVLVGGSPADRAGALAGALGAKHGAVVLRAADAGETGEGADAGHVHLLERAERLLHLGEHVVLDAPWATERQREAARSVGARTSSDLVELWCRPTPAGPATDDYDPWPEATVLPSDEHFTQSLDDASVACGWPSP